MKRLFRIGLVFWLTGIFLLPGKASAQCQLLLYVDNVTASQGNIMLAVFAKADGFPQDEKKAIKLQVVPAGKGIQKIDLGSFPRGKYAIAVYHDANKDGKLNTNRFGIPVEGYAFSNNVRGYFGPPDFEDAALVLEGKKELRVALVY